LSEKEVITFYQQKYQLEGIEFYDHINLRDNELTEDDFVKINTSIKNGNLLVIKNAYKLRNGMQKIMELLDDQSHYVNDSFRLILISKSNENLSNLLYENSVIFNRNSESDLTTLKDDAVDIFENVDSTHFENIINKTKCPLFSRKIFFHLAIVHNVLKQYHILSKDFYTIPFEFNKADFLNCYNFISNFFKTMEKEEKEIHVYLGLINLIYDNFYGNRLLLKDDFMRVTKIIMKFFEDDRFASEDFYFAHKNKKDKIEIMNVDFKDKEMKYDDIIRLLEEIPLESYYNIIENIDVNFIDEQLNNIYKGFYKKIYKINGWKKDVEMLLKIDFDTETKKWNLNSVNKKLQNYKNLLPLPIQIDEDSTGNTFKINKSGEYNYAIDESLKYEITSYNTFISQIYVEIDYFSRVFAGQVVYDEKFNNLLIDLGNNLVPHSWESKTLNLSTNKKSKNQLEEWIKLVNTRFDIVKNWLAKSTQECFYTPSLSNVRLFLFCVLHHFARKNNVTTEELELKLTPTKFYKQQEFTVSDDTFYINGLCMINARYDTGTNSINEKINSVPSSLPYIAITFGFVDFTEIGEILPEQNTINVPVYERIIDREVEIDSPLLYINFKTDDKIKDWNVKGIKIFLES